MTGQFIAVCAALLMLLLLRGKAGAQSSSQRAAAAAYSLKAAVDELHRREAAKYPLNAPPSSSLSGQQSPANMMPHYFATEPDDWNEDSNLFGNKNKNNRNRHRINKALAKYLELEEERNGSPFSPFGGYEFDDEQSDNNNLLIDDKKKRSSSSASSSFREYENGQPLAGISSVFRERESSQGGGGGGGGGNDGEASHSELTEQFLREIDEASERERQERYKLALRQLWEKYQQQENEISGPDSVPDNLYEQKKRMRTPYYLLMQKKRSYPVLPWLPYNADKRKRFPVAKRATKRSTNEPLMGKTSKKVADELSELFDKQTDDEVKKRSIGDREKEREREDVKVSATTHVPETSATALSDMRLEINFQRVNLTNDGNSKAGADELIQHGHAGHHSQDDNNGGDHQASSRHRKRNDHVHHAEREDSEESHETVHEEVDEHDEEGEESSDEDDHGEFDDDEEMDGDGEGEGEQRRKKKKRDAHIHPPSVGHLMLRAKKSIDWSQYFGLDRKKKSTTQLDETEEKKRTDAAQKKKREIDPEKLESMDKKLQSIEDFIIDETIKYTGAHEGISNQDEIRKLKDHVLSRLATAYSLEKMRRALDKLRQSVENENHLLRNVIEPESEENSLDSYWPAKKRESVKKEQADEANTGNQQSDSDVNNKKKKRSGYLRYPEQPNAMEDSLASAPYESLNDAYLGNKNYIIGSNQCPMIESMAERCRGVNLIAGDLNQELLSLCGVHQICYLCGTSQVACDYQYLAEAEGICGEDNNCQASVRSALMILRGTPGAQLGPRECLKNPCLYSAMREIGL